MLTVGVGWSNSSVRVQLNADQAITRLNILLLPVLVLII